MLLRAFRRYRVTLLLRMTKRTKHKSVGWEPVAATACFVYAFVSVGIGFVLTTRWFLDFKLHPLLHDLGIALLILGLPILILGGHFMDLRDSRTKRSQWDT